jgi:hypothetical protein
METIEVVDIADEAFPSEIFEQENALVIRTLAELSSTKDVELADLTIRGCLQ